MNNKMMLVKISEAKQINQMARVVASIQMMNRATEPGHAKRLLRQAINEAEFVNL